MYPACKFFTFYLQNTKCRPPVICKICDTFIFYMAYYCLKTQSNAVRNKLTLIFCLLTGDLTSFQGLPCFHTCQCPVADLQLISTGDLQKSCAVWVVCKCDKQSTMKQQNAVTNVTSPDNKTYEKIVPPS